MIGRETTVREKGKEKTRKEDKRKEKRQLVNTCKRGRGGKKKKIEKKGIIENLGEGKERQEKRRYHEKKWQSSNTWEKGEEGKKMEGGRRGAGRNAKQVKVLSEGGRRRRGVGVGRARWPSSVSRQGCEGQDSAERGK